MEVSHELKSQYRSEILNWYSETVEILIRLKIATRDDSLNKELGNELLSKLSAEIEVGRFYFPNVDKMDNFGKEKPRAYSGYRNLILDFLVFSYWIFEKEDAKRYWRRAETLQRYFTSHLFEIIDPKSLLKETEKHTDKTFTKELCFEDFIERSLMHYKINCETLVILKP